jgi:pyridoxine/pyridoxamine 5'-phosphate oxidase
LGRILVDNADEELYYLEANYVSYTVNYQHKTIPLRDNKALLERVMKLQRRLHKSEFIDPDFWQNILIMMISTI